VRQAAAEATGRLGDIRTIEPLVLELGDSNSEVRQAATEALDKIGRKQGIHPFKQIERMLAAVLDGNSMVRKIGAEALGRSGDERAIEPLIKLLKDREANVRQAAAEATGRLGDIQTIEPLILELGDSNSEVRQAATEALDKIGRKQGIHPFKQIEYMLAAIKNGNPAMRKIALEKMRSIDDGKAVRAIIDALKDTEREVVVTAIDCLVRKQEPYALFDLQELKARGGSLLKVQISNAIDALKSSVEVSLEMEKKQPVCKVCLTRFTKYKVKTGFMKQIPFFACRQCGMTRYRMEGVEAITAVLDKPWEEPFFREGDTLFINMVMRDRQAHLVDFDLLEIRNAPDVDLDDQVQHIIRRSGNDTFMDPKRLKTVPVRLVNNPLLTQNTLNLIKFKMKGVQDNPLTKEEKAIS
jgi:HEAT repeat protein